MARDFGIEDTEPRLQTAQSLLVLLRGLSGCEGKDRVVKLSEADLATSTDALSTARNKGVQVFQTLNGTKWEIFDHLRNLTGADARAAEALRGELIEALSQDEYVVALSSTLPDLETRAIRLLAPPPPRPDWMEIDQGRRESLDAKALGTVLDELRGRLEDDEKLRAEITWRLLQRNEGGEA